MIKARFPLYIVVSALLASPALLKAEGDASKGKDVFKKCGICHYTDVDKKKMGPTMKGLFEKNKLVNGKESTEENVIAIIKKGSNGMPAYEKSLSEQDLENLIAYLKTL